MASKKLINSVLVLRILTLLVLAASVLVMVLNSYKLSDGSKTSFADLHAYRYVVAVAGIGLLYTLIQIPFAAYNACYDSKAKGMRNVCLRYFTFYGDKIISYVLATGVGVGFGVTIEIRRFLDPFIALVESFGAADVDDERSKASEFLDKGLISSGILLAAFIFMALTSILTSLDHSSSSTSTSTLRKGWFRDFFGGFQLDIEFDST